MTAASSPRQIITFRVGPELFATDIGEVERVLRYVPPTRVPDMPEWVIGVIEYQHHVVAVMDMRTRFSLPPHPVTNETRVLVFRIGNDYVAGIVDAVLDVSNLDPSTIAPPPLFRGLTGDYMTGIARRQGELVMVLDMDRLLSTNERLVLTQVAAEHA